MLLDKLKWANFSGHWFTLFGLLNLIGYGAHFIMNKDQYLHHFTYNGFGFKLFNPIKSMMGSQNFSNVIWTAPALIAVNFYLLPKVGPLVMTKFFGLSLLSSVAFWSAFGPRSGLNYRPLKYFPVKFDSYSEDGAYYQGADQLAQAAVYFTLLYHRMWLVALPFMLYDTLYYGPASIGGPAAAVVGAMMFL